MKYQWKYIYNPRCKQFYRIQFLKYFRKVTFNFHIFVYNVYHVDKQCSFRICSSFLSFSVSPSLISLSIYQSIYLFQSPNKLLFTYLFIYFIHFTTCYVYLSILYYNVYMYNYIVYTGPDLPKPSWRGKFVQVLSYWSYWGAYFV